MPNTTDEKKKTTAKSIGQKVVWFVIAIASFAVVTEVKQAWFDNRAWETAGITANKFADDLHDKAARENPGQPAAYAAQAAAVKQSAEDLSKISGDAKAALAASQFTGFYLINVKTRADYCKSLGVDITPFVSAFKKAHAQMYAKSRVINGRGPYTADKVETEIYRVVLPTFQKTVNEAMTTIANEVKINETQLCQAFAKNSQAVSEIFLLSKLNPVLYQAMSEAK